MDTTKLERPSFHIECSPGPTIPENLFKTLVERYLRLECRGLYGHCFKDHTPENANNWYTESWDYTEEQANRILHYLTHFTEIFIRDFKLTGTAFDYVHFKIIRTSYIPKEIRRTLPENNN